MQQANKQRMKSLSINIHNNQLIWQQSNDWASEYSLEEFVDANPLEWMYINFRLTSERPDTVTNNAGTTRLASVEHVTCSDNKVPLISPCLL